MDKVWLVTGNGNGLGHDIVQTVLAAGDRVVAGARRLEELDALVAKMPPSSATDTDLAAPLRPAA